MKIPKQQIKEKLANYAVQFQIETSSFQKMAILHEYVNFIGNNKIFSEILSNNDKKTAEFVKEISKDNIDIDNFKSIFKDIGFLKDGVNLKDYPVDILELAKSVFRSLSVMAFAMEEYKQADDKRQKKLEANIKEVFSDPLKISIVNMQLSLLNTKLFNILDKEMFLNKNSLENKIIFDKEKSILHIKGKKVKIKRKADLPIEHYILEYLFEQDDKTEEAYYQDIATEKLRELEYNNKTDWKKYYNACERLQTKIQAETNINDFLIFTTNKTGNVKINKKYLQFLD